jgi:predicted dehydrogenase
VDEVVVALPYQRHKYVVPAVREAAISVFIEKPLAATVETV